MHGHNSLHLLQVSPLLLPVVALAERERAYLVFKKCYSSHYIESLLYVYAALNVDEKKLIAQFDWKSRDERFEHN